MSLQVSSHPDVERSLAGDVEKNPVDQEGRGGVDGENLDKNTAILGGEVNNGELL